MLNEPSGMSDALVVVPPREVTPPDPQAVVRSRLRRAVDEVFLVEVESHDLPEPVTVSFQGRLLIGSMEAYEKLDTAFKAMDHVPVFLTEGDSQVIQAMNGRFNPRPRPVWPNALLLALTILSLLFVGMTNVPAPGQPFTIFNLLSGWPYALCVMLILGSHELGHYFAARHHKVAVTLPYFIPFPAGLGTMGAFIQLQEPMRNRRVLLDVGAAGPLIGLIVAIPVLLIGLKTSPLLPLPIGDLFMLKARVVTYNLEGNSLLYIAAKYIAFGCFLPDGMTDVFINQVALAGWTGLLVTALNLIPIGQLDGGHALYSLIGDRARKLFVPALIALALMYVLFQYEGWLIWLVLILVLGRVYATPLDMITKLDTRRRVVSVVTLLVFVLVFMPLPMQIITVGAGY